MGYLLRSRNYNALHVEDWLLNARSHNNSQYFSDSLACDVQSWLSKWLSNTTSSTLSHSEWTMFQLGTGTEVPKFNTKFHNLWEYFESFVFLIYHETSLVTTLVCVFCDCRGPNEQTRRRISRKQRRQFDKWNVREDCKNEQCKKYRNKMQHTHVQV